MARTNTKTVTPAPLTHGGSPGAKHVTPINQLRRSVLACLLWEDTFYESGESIADRILKLCSLVTLPQLAALAVECRSVFNIRHASLLLLIGMLRHHHGKVVGDTIAATIQRADELAELLSLYQKINGKDAPLAKQLKRGLALAFNKFDAYSLAKYNRDADVKLRDVLFLVHAKPDNEQRAATWKQLVEGTLPTPDTWETELSAGKDKRATFERLIRENKLGYLALLRNLRNMRDAGVDDKLVREAIVARRNGADRVLPFRFIAAARQAMQYERELDTALCANIEQMPKLPGRTVVLVDVSGSMHARLSGKSDLTRIDAACALASVVHAESLRVFSFSDTLIEVPPRRGMAGADAISKSQRHNGTELAKAVAYVNAKVPHDRLIVITDEQGTDGRVPQPVAPRAYMINVGPYQHGVAYGKWTSLTGFSERILHWIAAHEAEVAPAD